jgi:predicted lipoprotein
MKRCVAALALAVLSATGWAQIPSPLPAITRSAAEIATQPMTPCSAEQALQGVYRHRLPALAQAFEQSTAQLVGRMDAHCQARAALADLRAQWESRW